MPRGGGNKLSQEQYLAKARAVHGERYDYAQTEFRGTAAPINVVCRTHGVFTQNAGHHARGSGCPRCKAAGARERRAWGTEEFIARAQSVHGTLYDYSRTTYVSQSTRVEIVCREHGAFTQLPQAHLRGHRCPSCAMTSRALASTSRRVPFAEFVRRARAVHGDRYEYAESEYQGAEEKTTITCRQHGSFTQRPAGHMAGNGCPRCRAARLSEQNRLHEVEVTDRLRAHPDTYEQRSFSRVKSPLRMGCAVHGAYSAKAGDVLYKGVGCPRCGVKVSRAEDEIAEYLRTLGLGVVQSDRTVLSPKELDITVPAAKFALEYNGLYYHSDAFSGARTRHKDKTAGAAAVGWRLVHVFEDEWKYRQQAVKATLAALLGVRERVGGAREFDLSVHPAKTPWVRAFLDTHHLQGAPRGGQAYVLGSADRPVAVMVLAQVTSERGASAGSGWELTRFCTAGGVPGAARRLFQAFLRDHPGQRVVSYSDNRWFTGGVYEALGFDRVHETPPSYTVVVGGRRVHKANFKKARLRALLGDRFDPGQTEKALCHARGWYRVYDCGLTKWQHRGTI